MLNVFHDDLLRSQNCIDGHWSGAASGAQPRIVGINGGMLAAEAAPFGGVKESGYGREGSRDGLEDYMHVKYLCQGGLQ